MRFSGLALLGALAPLALGIPTQPPIADPSTLPSHYAALIYNGFQAMDLFGPVDVFNSISMLYGNQTQMRFSMLASNMTPKSTSPTGGFGQIVVPTMTFNESLSSDIDVLIVPGGAGTRRDMSREIAFVKEIYPKLQYIISVCTGSYRSCRNCL